MRSVRKSIAIMLAAVFVVFILAPGMLPTVYAQTATTPGVSWLWKYATQGTDRGDGVAVGGGKVAFVGTTNSAMIGLSSAGGKDVFVLVYGMNRELQWVRQFGTTSDDAAAGVAADGSGNIYVVGETYGALSGEPRAGSSDLFLRKYTSFGSELWTRMIGSTALDTAGGIALDGSGNVYVLLDVSLGAAISGQTSAGGRDVALVKYGASGNRLWVRQFGSAADDWGTGLATSSSGAVFVSGSTEGAFPGQTAAGGEDAWLRKYDADGNVLWTRQHGTSGEDVGLGVATDGDGNVIVGGGTTGRLGALIGGEDAYLRKYDSNGNEMWTRQFGTPGYEAMDAVTVGANGEIYAVGTTSGVFAGQTSAGLNDVFVRLFSPAGDTQWTFQFGGPVGDFAANSAALDGEGGLYIPGVTTGVFMGALSAGGMDAFLVKVNVGAADVPPSGPCEQDLAAAQAQVQDLQGQLDEANATVQALQEQLAAANSLISTLQGQVVGLETENGQLEADKAALEATVSELTLANEGLVAENTRLQAEVNEVTAEDGALEAQLAELQTQVDDLTLANEGLTADNAALEGQVGALTLERDGLVTQVDELTAANEGLESQVAGLEAEVGALTAERDGLLGEVGELTDENARLVAENTALHTQVDELTLANEELVAQVAGLQTQVDGITEENRALQAQVAVLETEQAQLAADKAQMQVQIDEITQANEELEAERDRLTTEHQALVNANTQFQTQVDELTQVGLELTAENARLQGEVGALTATNEALRTMNLQLTHTVGELQAQNAELSVEVAALESVLADLRAIETQIASVTDDITALLPSAPSSAGAKLEQANSMLADSQVALAAGELDVAIQQVKGALQELANTKGVDTTAMQRALVEGVGQRVAKAIADIEPLVDPDDPKVKAAHWLLTDGQSLLHFGQYEDALDAFRKALQKAAQAG